jgi:hypothetical protein
METGYVPGFLERTPHLFMLGKGTQVTHLLQCLGLRCTQFLLQEQGGPGRTHTLNPQHAHVHEGVQHIHSHTKAESGDEPAAARAGAGPVEPEARHVDAQSPPAGQVTEPDPVEEEKEDRKEENGGDGVGIDSAPMAAAGAFAVCCDP